MFRVVAAADFDRDGHPDLAAMGAEYGSVSHHRLRLFLGNDTLLREVTVPGAGNVRAVVAFDADRDGDEDLFLGNFSTWPGTSADELLRNEGGGRFVSVPNLPADPFPDTLSAAAGDVDGDRDDDLVVQYTGGLRLLANDGQGRFLDQGVLAVPAGAHTSSDVCLVDLDLDGAVDLWASGSPGYVLWNDGSGTFATTTLLAAVGAPVTVAATVADFDGDARPDCAIQRQGERLRLFVQRAARTFVDVTAAYLPNMMGVTGIAALDLDVDGRVELVAGFAAGPLLVLRADPLGVFQTVRGVVPDRGFAAERLLAADVDGDSRVDLLVAGAENHVQEVLVADGVRLEAWTTPRLPPDVVRVKGATTLDADGDADLDIAVATEAGNKLLRNDGTGFFELVPDALPPAVPVSTSVVAGDFDRDGDDDLLFAEYQRPLSLYANDGTGRFHFQWPGYVPTQGFLAGKLFPVDIDADGDLDVVAVGAWTSGIWLLRNDGTGRLLREQPLAAWTPGQQTCAALGDLDGDGLHDLVVGGQDQWLPLRVFLGNGVGFYDASARCAPPNGYRIGSLDLGDVDRDGDLDLAILTVDGPLLLRNDGTGVLTPWPSGFPNPPNSLYRGGGFVDVDGDGDLDLVSDGQVRRVWSNNGAGQFVAGLAALPVTWGYIGEITFPDLDRDGDQDMLIVNKDFYLHGAVDGRSLCVLVNVQRQLLFHGPLRIGARWSAEILHRVGSYDLALLASNFHRLAPAVPLPPFGVLQIDMSGPIVHWPGNGSPLPSSVEWHIGIPAMPGLVGLSGWFQGVLLSADLASCRLTNLVGEPILR